MQLGRLQLRRTGCQLSSRSSARRQYHRQAPSHQQQPGPLLLQSLLHAARIFQDKGSWPTSLLAFALVAPETAFEPPGHYILAQTRESEQPGTGSWTKRLMTLNAPAKKSMPAAQQPAQGPQTIAEAEELVAANAPVFFFHTEERYFPCTVEWFLERAKLVQVAKGWRRTVLQTLVDYGKLDAQELESQQAAFAAKDPKERSREFLQLQLQPSARKGEQRPLNQIPIYAHVRQTLDPVLGKRDSLEIVYMKFLAFNGPYKLFRSLWVGPLGAHDGDWEHVTVRLTPDGRRVLGVYYSAHRHRDGVWRSADEVPRSDDGRPLAFIAENGHGSYPTAGTIFRLFFVINDYTSADGKKWDPEKVILLTQNAKDKLPAVVSRGSSLNGSSYPVPSSSRGKLATEVQRQDAPWLKFEGKWGSTVEAPQRQEWWVRAENPVSRTWLQQIFFPLLPGVESIWEPAREELEEAVGKLQDGLDEGMDVFKDTAEDVQREFERSRKQVYKRWQTLIESFKRRDE